MKALITGGAGFIGSHVVDRFLNEGWFVTVVDNFDDFYDPAMKRRNLAHHTKDPRFRLVEVDIRDRVGLLSSASGHYDVIVHLAARPGVRASMKEPGIYYDVNVRGTLNVLKLARSSGMGQFIFASSSSVYGREPKLPWSEDLSHPDPISPYAFTKLTAEMLGRDFAARHGLRFIALRFFTVYGPRQRPDLAIHRFTTSILRGQSIPVYGDGTSSRDYTFIEDIVDGIWGAKEYRGSNFEVMNLGSGAAISIIEMVESLRVALGMNAVVRRDSEKPGDLKQTLADWSKAHALIGYAPRVSLSEGLARFANWISCNRGLAKAS